MVGLAKLGLEGAQARFCSLAGAQAAARFTPYWRTMLRRITFLARTFARPLTGQMVQ